MDVAAPAVPTTITYGRKSPLSARLTLNRRLSGRGSAKDVRQLGFRLPESTLTYQAGDSLGVWPRNSRGLVEEWLKLTRLDGDAEVTLRNYGPMSLRAAVTERLEIANLTPALITMVAEQTHDVELMDLLRVDQKPELVKYMWGRQSVDLLSQVRVRSSLDQWLAVLKPLRPRQYSISSSPRLNPLEVQLTVSAVRYNSSDVVRHGVCSTFLADHAGRDDVQIFVQSQKNFRVPADLSTPMIMIGPGTGVAPFRAFLHERRALGHPGKNWLFFGEQHESTDFYYRDELMEMRRSGHLERFDVAFSRDERQKVYVQDRMREHGPQLWEWLQNGAHFYVCGDATRMADDVDRALHDIVELHGNLDIDEAEAYVKNLVQQKRYVRDVY